MRYFVSLLVLATMLFISEQAYSQRGRSKAKPTNPVGGNVQDTTKNGRGRGTTTTGTTSTGNKTTASEVPQKRFDTTQLTEGGGKEYGAKILPSKRNGYGYERNAINDRKPLPYDHIREEDATYSQFVWREIDGREKMNLPFIYKAKDDDGDQRFFSILLNAMKKDSVMAFRDERFSEPYDIKEALGLTTKYVAGVYDTTYSENINDENIRDTVISLRENKTAPKPDSVYKFRIKEQWMFDRESSRLTVRIIAIAPLAPDIVPGKPIKGKSAAPVNYYPMFWLYYPDLRGSLSKSFAYNPKNVGGRMTWEEIFEGRYFSSFIYKSTLDNPNDLTIARMIKDPLFRLYEGENIKEKIFNYEQDLWQY